MPSKTGLYIDLFPSIFQKHNDIFYYSFRYYVDLHDVFDLSLSTDHKRFLSKGHIKGTSAIETHCISVMFSMNVLLNIMCWKWTNF